MINIQSIHHIAIICSDYERSKKFYVDVLGFEIASEHFRNERHSWKLDLNLNGKYAIELFSFPDSRKGFQGQKRWGYGIWPFKLTISTRLLPN